MGRSTTATEGDQLGAEPSGTDLGGVVAAIDEAVAARLAPRLHLLVRRYRLDPLEARLLLLAAAPELDRRVAQLYAELDDASARGRATVSLLGALTGPVPPDTVRVPLAAGSTLVRQRLLELVAAEAPWAGHEVRVPARVALFLAGSDVVDDEVSPLIRPVVACAHPDATRVAAVLLAGDGTCYLRSRTAVPAWSVASQAVAEAGLDALVIDLSRAPADADRGRLLTVAAREAALLGSGLVVGPVEDLRAWPPTALAGALAGPAPVVLVGAAAWDPSLVDSPVLVVEVDPAADRAVRGELWAAAVPGWAPDADLEAVLHGLRLTPEQIADAGHTAATLAATDGAPVGADHIAAGVRSQNGGKLTALAHRRPPGPSFDDLVLPSPAASQLRQLADRVRHRDLVVDQWGLGGPDHRSRGTAALFAGPSGTGKTLSAHVVAGALGLDLYTIDLSAVVDKYIGETEKNLERLFREAEGVNGVLFFDEADAVLGKRAEVSDARDRYANLEVAYLLQRIERFDGLVVLATNLRANLDEAYLRRFDALVHFPEPEEAERLALWQLHLGSRIPVADDVDLGWLARRFRLAGGAIRNVTVTAAYLAAAAGGAMAMEHLVRATAQELTKLGRLCTEDDFGPWFSRLGLD